MKKSILNLGQAISKETQRNIKGGNLSNLCTYECRGKTAVQPSGSSEFCLINFPIAIFNSPMCGGGDEGDHEVWA